MTKSERLYHFFSSFGITAYEENCVPASQNGITNDAPYLVYEDTEDTFYGEDINLTCQIFDKNSSYQRIEEIADTMSRYITSHGKVLPIDGGYILIMRGTPWMQKRKETGDKSVKGVVLTLTVRYYVEN